MSDRCPCGQLLPADDHPVREISGMKVITCPLHPPGKLTIGPPWMVANLEPEDVDTLDP